MNKERLRELLTLWTSSILTNWLTETGIKGADAGMSSAPSIGDGAESESTRGGRWGEGRQCDPYDDFTTECEPENPFECHKNGDEFVCNDDPNYAFHCNSAKDGFDCDEHFDCKGFEFRCLGEFQCEEKPDYHCDSGIFDCTSDPLTPAEKFECVHSSNGGLSDFDCTNETTFDFMCERGIPREAGFDCPESASDFECSTKHIFKCCDEFSCPTSHHCKPPKRTCSPELEGWEPPEGDRDDGDAGDFDCDKFTCGASEPGNPQQKFECGLSGEEGGPSSDFKCLDGEGTLQEQFHCGLGSEFECGEEEERFVCMNYRCEDSFRCESAFHCGNKEKGREYECSILNFQCRQVTPNPAEDGYACDDEAGGYICEVFNCDQEGYQCNPPNEFAGCSEGYAVPDPWP